MRRSKKKESKFNLCALNTAVCIFVLVATATATTVTPFNNHQENSQPFSKKRIFLEVKAYTEYTRSFPLAQYFDTGGNNAELSLHLGEEVKGISLDPLANLIKTFPVTDTENSEAPGKINNILDGCKDF